MQFRWNQSKGKGAFSLRKKKSLVFYLQFCKNLEGKFISTKHLKIQKTRLVDISIFYFEEGREGCGSQRKTRKTTKICFVIFLVKLGNKGVCVLQNILLESAYLNAISIFFVFHKTFCGKQVCFPPTKRTLHISF